MELFKEDLGKVAITVEKDYWDITKAYDRLVIVEVKSQDRTYISRQPVPTGVAISNRDYWIPFSSLQENITTKVLAIYNDVINKYNVMQNRVDEYKIYEALSNNAAYTGIVIIRYKLCEITGPEHPNKVKTLVEGRIYDTDDEGITYENVYHVDYLVHGGLGDVGSTERFYFSFLDDFPIANWTSEGMSQYGITQGGINLSNNAIEVHPGDHAMPIITVVGDKLS